MASQARGFHKHDKIGETDADASGCRRQTIRSTSSSAERYERLRAVSSLFEKIQQGCSGKAHTKVCSDAAQQTDFDEQSGCESSQTLKKTQFAVDHAANQSCKFTKMNNCFQLMIVLFALPTILLTLASILTILTYLAIGSSYYPYVKLAIRRYLHLDKVALYLRSIDVGYRPILLFYSKTPTSCIFNCCLNYLKYDEKHK